VLTISRRVNRLIRIVAVAGLFAFGWLAMVAQASPDPPTFNQQVAPILFKHCVICHRPGEIASAVSLAAYDTARPWAKSIREKVLTREMPPWPADSGASLRFRNDPRLSQKEIDSLVDWVNAGAPQGKNVELPPLPTFSQGWVHPKGLAPDLIVSMPGEFAIPAQGQMPYVRYLANVPLTGDKWIAGLQVRPGNRSVVHHMAITEVALEKGTTPADLDAMALIARQLGFQNSLPGSQPAVTAPGDPAAFDMLGVYTPGTTSEIYGDASGKLLKGGQNYYINFNVHYQPTGKPEKDRSEIAFWFLPAPPKHQLFRVPGATKTILSNGQELLADAPGKRAEGTGSVIPPIPPNNESYEVLGIEAFADPVTIYQLQPHAHVRCKDFKYFVVYPDGREQTLLSVPRYNFQWQLAYDLETPLSLPAGSKLVVIAHYDNSSRNKYNPAADKEVIFRDGENQSWDEMFTPFLQYSIDTPSPASSKSDTDGIVEVDGCFEQKRETWVLANATEPMRSETQSTTSLALKNASSRSLGHAEYELLGISMFNPSSHKRQKVAAKGIFLRQSRRINVTSFQMVAAACGT
jgi:hypothetical protein